jgi:predicted metal-dependent hydrolase
MNNNTIEHHKIKYGSQVIPFQLEYRKRKTLEISVYPDMSVRVKAPLKRTYCEIEEKVRKRAAWIIEQRYFFSLFLPMQPAKKYISGESHFYLGKQYRLKVVNSTEEKVVLKRGIINVYAKDRNDSTQIKTLLDRWYRQRATIKYAERLNLCYAKTKRHGMILPNIQIRKMKKRWGSCSKQGAIILNTQLIKAPSHCVDYVIMHEMCHLKYFNHGKLFYDLLVKVMPDWEKRKKRLEQVINCP